MPQGQMSDIYYLWFMVKGSGFMINGPGSLDEPSGRAERKMFKGSRNKAKNKSVIGIKKDEI